MWRYLRAHPEIFMSELKEPGFMCFAGGTPVFNHVGDENFYDQIVTDEAQYLALFDDGSNQRYRGESSSFYLYFDSAQKAIAERAPDAKLLIVLRDPIERIWSSHRYLRRLGGEPIEDLAAALDAEPQRIEENWEPLFHYVTASRYSQQLERLYEKFDRSQVHVAVLERLEGDANAEMRRVFSWLGVDEEADVGAEVIHNAAGSSRIPGLDKVLSPGFLPSGLADRIPRGLKDRAVKVREKARVTDHDPIPVAIRERLMHELEGERATLPGLVDFDPADHWATFQ